MRTVTLPAKLEVPNPALLKEGIKSYSLGKTFEERRITFKYIYEKFLESEGIIGELAEEFKLTTAQIVYCAYHYKHLAFMADEKVEDDLLITSGIGKFDYEFVFDKLKAATTKEEIIKILDSSGIKISYLRQKTKSRKYLEDSQMLLDKLNFYSEYFQQREAEEFLLTSAKYVSMFIDSKEFYSKKTFCDFANIDESTFNSYVDAIKSKNQELYKKYKEKSEINAKRSFAISASIVKKIVSMLKNGVEENGIKRKFDILDYYQNTSLSFGKFTEISIQICDLKELGLVRNFVSANSKYTKDDPYFCQKILSIKQTVIVQTDENGFAIPDTPKEIDKKTKLIIVNYLKDNNIPANMKTYNLALGCYLKKTLFNNKSKPKTLKKIQEPGKSEN